MESLSERAPAKINLTLQVVGRRSDGYHLLRSLVGFADVGDVLHFSPGKEITLKITGPFADGLNGADLSDNLVVRAAGKLAAVCNVQQGAEIHLVKNLPIASGIGGGSADAAAALRGLTRLWGLENFPTESLSELALELGADVPVCLESKCCWMEGIGESLTPGPDLPEIYAVLLNPGVAVSTPMIFKSLNGYFSAEKEKAVRFSSQGELADYLKLVGNDLQAPACAQEPVIATALDELSAQEHCLLSAMSGSGATCFGLFSSFEVAQRAARKIQQKYPGWWLAPATFR